MSMAAWHQVERIPAFLEFGDQRGGDANPNDQSFGTFSDPNASGWQAWDWVPLLK